MLQNKNLHTNNNQKPLQEVTTNINHSNKPRNSENYYNNKHKEDLEEITKITNSISETLNLIDTYLPKTPNTKKMQTALTLTIFLLCKTPPHTRIPITLPIIPTHTSETTTTQRTLPQNQMKL